MAEDKTEKQDKKKEQGSSQIPQKEDKGNEVSTNLPKAESKSKAEKKPKKSEEKKEVIELEREYIIPLRKGTNKVPRYRRAKKAISVIRKFLARHMKVENRDEKKIKIDTYLNQEIWFRGIKKPAGKIKVKAVKKDGVVYAELVDIPDVVKFAKAREEKRKAAAAPKKKKAEAKPEEKTEEEKVEEKEKEKASVEAGLKRQEKAAKAVQHTAKGAHKQKTMPVRKSLKK